MATGLWRRIHVSIVLTYDFRQGIFPSRCNMESVDLEAVEGDEEEQAWLKALLEEFHERTGSVVAKDVLDAWPESLQKFHKVSNTSGRTI